MINDTKTFNDCYFEYTDKITGHMYEQESRLLWELGCKVPNGGKVVEIGSDLGRSSTIWLFLQPYLNTDVTLVDNFSYSYNSAEELKKNLAPLEEKGARYTLLAMDSVAAATENPGGIDLMFIDADHTNPGVDNDLKNWLPKLKEGGVVIFHDYENSSFPDVTDAVDKYCAGWEAIGTAPLMIAFRKPVTEENA